LFASIMQALYYDLAARIRATWANPIYAAAGRHAETLELQTGVLPANRVLRNSHDGSIMCDTDFFPKVPKDSPERRYCMHLMCCWDAAEWKKGQSFTPILGVVLDWPLEVRNAQGSLWCMGVFPDKIRNYQNMHRPNAEQFAACGPDSDGVEIVDAFDGTTHTSYVAIVIMLNDLRGYYQSSMGKSAPCYVGNCPMCGVTVRTRAPTYTHMHACTQLLPWALVCLTH
jgi:hypothetical protein